MRIIKKLGWLILVIIIVAQFFGPDKNQGDINDLTSFLRIPIRRRSLLLF